MSSALAGSTAVWRFVRADATSGRWTLRRDRHPARLRAALADPDARLFVADAPPSLSERVRDHLLGLWWWRTVEATLPIRARIVRGRRIKITTLIAVVREVRADGQVRDLAESFARDPIQREAIEDEDDPALSDCVAATWDGAGG